MSQYGWADCPTTVRRQVDVFVGGVREILVGDLVGVYLHGSLAMGCFNPQRSDIDLLVVTRQGMSAETKRRIAELLLRTSNDPRPIETSFLSEAMLRPWRHPAPFDFHFGEEWRERVERRLAGRHGQHWMEQPETDGDLAAHVTITRRRGICLYGKPVADVFPDVPREDYVDSIVSDFEWGLERVEHFPVYFVLNACRVLAYLREGRVCSKDEGGEWALRSLPIELKPTAAQALDVYRGNRDDGGFRPEFPTMFAQYVEEQIGLLIQGAYPWRGRIAD